MAGLSCEEEITSWRAKDPLDNFIRRVTAQGELTAKDISDIRRERRN
jgi:TPP-dependent pyruvate/acetoin dehydrogenase alpha subunit